MLDVFRRMIGFDKQIGIRPLNKTNMFLLSMQWFGTFYPDHDENLIAPVPIPGKFLPITNDITGQPIMDLTQYPKIKQMENVFTALMNTMYMRGTLNPQVACAYEARGAWLILPSVQFIREPFRFGLQYAAVVGNFVGFGVLRDRDQIPFNFAYLLN